MSVNKEEDLSAVEMEERIATYNKVLADLSAGYEKLRLGKEVLKLHAKAEELAASAEVKLSAAREQSDKIIADSTAYRDTCLAEIAEKTKAADDFVSKLQNDAKDFVSATKKDAEAITKASKEAAHELKLSTQALNDEAAAKLEEVNDSISAIQAGKQFIEDSKTAAYSMQKDALDLKAKIDTALTQCKEIISSI